MEGMERMRIAVTYEKGQVFQHFGHTERFKVYDIKDGEIALATVVNTDGSGHGALADLLRKGNIDTLICGGIGAGAQSALKKAGINFYGGVKGEADQVVKDFLDGKLQYDPNVKCNHHHHGEEHTCGTHGCGEH